MNLLIGFCVILSYFLGAKSILQGKYQPSIYSRIIWFLLAANNFFSVVVLNNNFSVLVLAGLGLLGNLAILLLSLKKSKRIFGKIEIISSILLLFSLDVFH